MYIFSVIVETHSETNTYLVEGIDEQDVRNRVGFWFFGTRASEIKKVSVHTLTSSVVARGSPAHRFVCDADIGDVVLSTLKSSTL